jgi:beta-xylosidase
MNTAPAAAMTTTRNLAASALLALAAAAPAQDKKTAGNPVFEGWYADPEGIIFDDQYWIYPTYSAPYGEQTHFDAFSSADLAKWKKHSSILDTKDIKWAKRAMWAPSIIEKDKKYYFFFSANDIQNNEQEGGIGVAVASKPDGPFKDHIGKPLVDKFHHGAQPIDGFVFKDDDGSYYLIYGGWRHCNIAKLTDDFKGFVPFEGGETFKSITPDGYVEGPFVFKKDGKYYFMWSEGGWTGPDYRVAYAVPTNASASCSSRMPLSPPVPATIPSSTTRRRIAGTSSITAALSARPMATTASPASTRWSSTPTARSSPSRSPTRVSRQKS